MVDLSAIPEWFQKTDAGAAIVEDAERAELDRRRRLVSEIEELRAERDAVMPGRRAKLREAEERAEDARAALEAAVAAQLEVQREVHQAAHDFETGIRDREAELRGSADPAIEEFRDWLHEEFERTRHTQWEHVFFERRVDLRWGGTGRRTERVTNIESIRSRLDAIREAMRSADRLKLAALSREELEARIEEIRGALPEIRPAEAFIPLNGKPTPPPGTEEEEARGAGR